MGVLSVFIKKYNELITERRLRVNNEIIKYFLKENPRITSKTLDFNKHRTVVLDWFLDNYNKIEKLKLKKDFNFDFYTYPLEIVLAKPARFDKKIKYLGTTAYKEGDIVEKIPLRHFVMWKKMCLGSSGKVYYYREKKRKRSFYATMCVSDFVSLKLPPRGTPLGWNIESLKPQIISFIKRYGYPFSGEDENWRTEENSFFYYFIHKWLRANDLLILKKNYPNFPRIKSDCVNLDIVKFDINHYKELVDEVCQEGIKQTPEGIINQSQYLYDNFESLYGMILNAIIFPPKNPWKKCEHIGCEQWFIPAGKNKRGCCALHASSIRAQLFRTKHRLTSKK